jgi:large subunit ribosomal protein L25
VAENTLNVEVRDATGKGVARKLRAVGRIPGNCYGQAGAQSISLDPAALDRLIRGSASGANTLIDLKVVGGGSFDGKKVLLKEMQRDPVSNEPLHADFFALDLMNTIDIAVPVHATGTPVGVAMMGGILDQVLREIHVECLPNAIPEEILADVTDLEIGMSIHVRDLPLPEGVKLVSDGDLSVISVAAPKEVEEEVPAEEELTEEEAAAAAAAEPESEEAEKSEESSGD